jgi:hypothetical protein
MRAGMSQAVQDEHPVEDSCNEGNCTYIYLFLLQSTTLLETRRYSPDLYRNLTPNWPTHPTQQSSQNASGSHPHLVTSA